MTNGMSHVEQQKKNDLEMLNVSMKPMGSRARASGVDTPVFSSLFHASKAEIGKTSSENPKDGLMPALSWMYCRSLSGTPSSRQSSAPMPDDRPVAPLGGRDMKPPVKPSSSSQLFQHPKLSQHAGFVENVNSIVLFPFFGSTQPSTRKARALHLPVLPIITVVNYQNYQPDGLFLKCWQG